MSTTTQQVGNQSETPTDEDAHVELSEDQIYHLLQNERRRNVLRYLHDADEQVSMRDIAEQVAAWENDITVQTLSSSERQRVYIPLYQSHLPKLDEEGVIEYDQSRGTVRKTPLADKLYDYLEPTQPTTDEEVEDDEDTHWERYYLGASGLGATVLAGTTLGVTPFALLPQSALGFLILGMFWSLTVGQRFA
ncbi:DUF7344 domain-containing protein [Haladaptatus cibarius]|uniref:DUF7344 domain-containing protein n=1 Tax=Haladaptatus cibarius TaxID=453847 RepID=UPI00067962A0|nr:hypothetical protein [Haladaptatus cibarius]